MRLEGQLLYCECWEIRLSSLTLSWLSFQSSEMFLHPELGCYQDIFQCKVVVSLSRQLESRQLKHRNAKLPFFKLSFHTSDQVVQQVHVLQKIQKCKETHLCDKLKTCVLQVPYFLLENLGMQLRQCNPWDTSLDVLIDWGQPQNSVAVESFWILKFQPSQPYFQRTGVDRKLDLLQPLISSLPWLLPAANGCHGCSDLTHRPQETASIFPVAQLSSC